MNWKVCILLSLWALPHFLKAQNSEASKYKAGFKTVSLVDESRVYKPFASVTDRLHYRPLDLDIWYPADETQDNPMLFQDLFQLFEQRTKIYQEETDYSGITEELAQFFVAELGVGTNGETLLQIPTNSFLGAKPVRKVFPLIVYMAGFNGMGFENYTIFEELAKNGFVVVSISSIGRYPGDMTNELEDTMEQVLDAEFAIDYLEKQMDLEINTSNIGVLGCSWGGMSAAMMVNRNPKIKAMVSLDGSETHYFGEGDNDTNLYANDATAEDNDQFIRTIHSRGLLDPESQVIKYLYMESGDKLSEFSPTEEFHYFKQLSSEKYYLRFRNSEHAHFTCIPAILNASPEAVINYGQIQRATVLFFKDVLLEYAGFKEYWAILELKENTTNRTYRLSLEEKNVNHSGGITLNGMIMDMKTKEPLPYVNIGILNGDLGTVTNDTGFFELDLAEGYNKDTLRISMIGYKSIELLVSELIANPLSLQVLLEEEISELGEVVVTAKAFKRKTLGNKTTAKFLSAGFSHNQLGAEMGIKINVRKAPNFVDSFNFSVSQNRLSTKTIFRLNFYKVEKGRPANNILRDNIFVTIDPKQTGLVRVDLRPYDIVLKEDVIVTLEWVDSEGENIKGEAIFFSLGLLTTGTLHKQSSQGKFKRLNNLGVGFNIDVRY
ncbi:carboxypeptidase-like regulatory domain-containing protein [Eudoraea chungangensis]|uniref:carboxypeptidase-like regulatory domain-containing protein n=1 Tax=Eudoraea chungangensis TaxID=1481905 RepID=UPI0023ED20B2|nr:carboxypeptidase-like regulatory domain-containing protein [Eudoraea chungangensis]